MRTDRPAERAEPGRVLALVALLGMAGMLTAGGAVGAGIGSLHHSSTGVGHLTVAGLVFSYPAVTSAEWLLLGLSAFGTTALTVAGRAAWRQSSTYRRFLARLEIVGHLDGHPTVSVIAGSQPEAFCAGYLKPKVYISRGALRQLTVGELEAVLAHERHHTRVRDPLRFALAGMLSQALFFMPVLRSLRDRYVALAEVNADRAAVRASAGRQSPLASALLVFEASAPPGTSGISPERVDALLGEPAGWRIPSSRLAASLGVVVALSLLSWEASRFGSVRATFNLPWLSSQPCAAMTLLLLMVCVAAVMRRVRER